MSKYLCSALLLFGLPLHTGAMLIDGDIERGKEKSQACIACHGTDGNSPAPMWPKIAGQHADYLLAQLKAYQSGERKDPQMSPMVEDLSEQDMKDLAVYYAAQTIQPGGADPDTFEEGETLYRAGNRDTGVPACIGCHGPRGAGIPGTGYPALGGQYADYTAAQLKAYRSGERGGGQADVMHAIAEPLTDEEIEAVANYLSGLH
jgi:cytochrome c553